MKRAVVIVVVLLLALIVLEIISAEVVLQVVGGWVGFLRRVGPRVAVQWEMVLSCAAYALAFVLGAHLFMRWLWREARKDAPAALRVWPMRWTVCGAAAFGLLFVVGTAATGVVDQSARFTSTGRKWVSRVGKVACRRNFQTIGERLAEHVGEHGGVYPNDLAVLLEREGFDPWLFVCVDDEEKSGAAGKTPAERVARFRKGECCSYVYLAGGRKGVSKDDVVMYEPPANHEWTTVNVLFGDGRVEMITVERARALIPGMMDRP